MKRVIGLFAVALFCALTPLGAENCPFNLDQIAAKAKETVDVTLDSSTLQLASKFLSSGKAKELEAAGLLTGVKAICVRHYEFANEGGYAPGDVQRVRDQLRAPAWTRIVNVREQKESSEVFTRSEGGQVTGIALIAAEPKELTVVFVDGPIDLDKLSKFGGQFGIPPIPVPGAMRKPSK
jgi:hypothetical protein